MAVVRVDDRLLKELKKLVEGDKTYKYPSIAAFVNRAIHEKMKRLNDGKA